MTITILLGVLLLIAMAILLAHVFTQSLKRATTAGYNAGIERGVNAMTEEAARHMARVLGKLEVCPNAVRLAQLAIEMEDSIAAQTNGAQGEVKALERMYSHGASGIGTGGNRG